MKLKVVVNGDWKIVAPLNGDKCELLEWLAEQRGNYESNVNALLGIFNRISTDPRGPRVLPDALCHEADKKLKLYEFIKGDLRILWFYGDDMKIVICSHGILKKGQTIKAAEKARATTLKKLCSDAYQNGTLIYDEEKI